MSTTSYASFFAGLVSHTGGAFFACSHQCAELEDLAGQGKLDRGEAADAQNAWGFSKVGEEGLEHANSHVRVRIARL